MRSTCGRIHFKNNLCFLRASGGHSLRFSCQVLTDRLDTRPAISGRSTGICRRSHESTKPSGAAAASASRSFRIRSGSSSACVRPHSSAQASRSAGGGFHPSSAPPAGRRPKAACRIFRASAGWPRALSGPPSRNGTHIFIIRSLSGISHPPLSFRYPVRVSYHDPAAAAGDNNFSIRYTVVWSARSSGPA